LLIACSYVYVPKVPPRKRRLLAPRYGVARIELKAPLAPPNTLAAHGTDRFPAFFTFEVSDEQFPYTIVLHVHTNSRGSAPTGAQVVPLPGGWDWEQPLPAVKTVLQEMDVDEFVADAVGAVVAEAERIPWRDVLSEDPAVREEALQQLQVAVNAAKAYRQRRYTPRGPALLEEVARVYTEAFRAGKNPTAAVQNMRPPTGYSTAAAWVRQARKAGLLPPAVKGRPGWKDEP
jgi:hypothetical protein